MAKFTFGLWACSAVFWFAETWYFGWNNTPESPAEYVCDTIAGVMLLTASVGFGWLMYRTTVEAQKAVRKENHHDD